MLARAKKFLPHIEIGQNSRLDHSEIIDLSFRTKKDDCTMTGTDVELHHTGSSNNWNLDEVLTGPC